jgi:hypothetical protein
MMGGMSKEWKPPKEDADVFAQYKAHVEGERKLKPEMEKAADRALASEATVGQLARHTGLTPEVFRRRARKLGIEHKRPPTVGKLRDAPEPPAPRPQVTQALRKPVPGISPKVRALDRDRVRWLADKARERKPDWVEELRQEYPHLRGPDLDYLIVDLGHQKGFKIPELDEPTATDEATDEENPTTDEEQTA